MGCEGCYSSQKAIEQSLSDIRIKAKQFAIDNETTVFIFTNEYNEPAFMAEEAARAQGIIPTMGIVSNLRDINR